MLDTSQIIGHVLHFPMDSKAGIAAQLMCTLRNESPFDIVHCMGYAMDRWRAVLAESLLQHIIYADVMGID